MCREHLDHCSRQNMGPCCRFIPACAGNTHQGEIQFVDCCHRFIPACAGNTCCKPDLSRRPNSSVHPRVCREHNVESTNMSTPASRGSSPRVQGTRFKLRKLSSAIQSRFIPACAGNTSDSEAFEDAISFGSSPRVQGTRSPDRGRMWNPRFIPACAGNTTLDDP